MVRPPAFLARNLLTLQLAVVIAAMLLGAFYPPATGKMILVPLLPGAQRTMLTDAISGGALLVGRGPLPNSFVVAGERREIAAALMGHGILMLAAPPAACGETWLKA